MRFFNLPCAVLLCTLSLVSLPACLARQARPANAEYDANRHKAQDLFNHGKRLEALPVLEKLVEANPKDDEMLVELAACLIDHAATLSDQAAAAQERFRARELVQKAWDLGNTNLLTENLRQLLGQLPANGEIKFSANSEVEKIMDAGEAAFAQRDFDEALKQYAKALELEPTNYSAALFTANAYDRKNDFDKAGEWYERAMRLDPNVETAYRYYADMLAKQGDMAKSRAMLIHAAVAEPYNKIVWREIRAWAIINKTAFNLVYAGIPLPKGGLKVSDNTAQDLSSAWRIYFSVKDAWKKGDRFQKQFPQEATYRHSLPEESEALLATIKILEKLKADKKTAGLVDNDPVAGLLLKMYAAGAIDAYVLFSLGDDGIAKDYVAYRAKNRDKLEAYMDTFVMPPPPAKQ